MRHHNAKRKFGRTRGERKAFMRSLALGLIRNGKMKTTLARAKEVRPFVEKLVTRAKRATLADKRILIAELGTNERVSLKQLLDTIAPSYKDRAGGYTRITRVPVRKSDGAAMAVIEFV